MLTPPRKTVRKARAQRRMMTLPEVLLWRELRKRPRNLKFRRQHPVGDYVLDFFNAESHLAIEVDGDAHNRGERPARDGIRDAWLNEKEIDVLRIPAGDVLHDVNDVVERTVDAAGGRIPLHQPEAGPPPRSGEDLG
ncbi:MAG: endonuclease domain-containing protein [Pseudomonadota bacterium]